MFHNLVRRSEQGLRAFCKYGTSSRPPVDFSRSNLPKISPFQGGQHVAVAISGGVDSAVAALLLKASGFKVTGIFMHNWDEAEELGNENCSTRQDLADAGAVCKQLAIPLEKANFVKEYWTEVFTPFISQYERGLTPNPDLLCNKAVKFNHLLQFAKSLGADCLATGHYAALKPGPEGAVQLLQPRDKEKDQTYFLASVPSSAFQQTMFPLSQLTKSMVREIAASVGLHNALRRSSAGICFIGRRDFADFLSGYMQPVAGRYIDVDGMHEVGICKNLSAITQGQGARISGAEDKMFVVGKDIPAKTAYVAKGSEHLALYTHSALLRSATWISGHPPELQQIGQNLHFKARYRQQLMPCDISPIGEPQNFTASQFTRLLEDDMPHRGPSFTVSFPRAARAITPQQEFVMYNGEVCLGSAPVWLPGLSLHEEKASYPQYNRSRLQACL